jgi:hypothetical protein
VATVRGGAGFDAGAAETRHTLDQFCREIGAAAPSF